MMPFSLVFVHIMDFLNTRINFSSKIKFSLENKFANHIIGILIISNNLVLATLLLCDTRHRPVKVTSEPSIEI